MLRKLIVVYNPRSSQHAAVTEEVLAPARKLSGWLVGKYEVKASGLRENADDLAKILNDGDLVIAAGGDGTAAMAVNGIMRSGKDVVLGVLGYGNFNDLARMLKVKRAVEYGGEFIGGVSEIVERFVAGKVQEIYPLEALVDGKHWRYAPCYLSLGLFAESTVVFDEPKVREKLQTGKKHMLFSIWTLMKWYFRNRKRDFLPEGEIYGAWKMVEVPIEETKVKTRKVKPEKVKGTEEVERKVKVDAGVKKELEAVQADEKVEEKKFKALMKAARKQQLAELKAGAKAKMLEAGAQTKAKMVLMKTGAQAKLLNVKIKTQDKMVKRNDKARVKRGDEAPEIIIEGAEVVERRKKKQSEKKTMACAVEKKAGKMLKRGTTDYIAVNGPILAKMMRGGRYYKRPVEFRSTTAKLGSFWRMVGFMMRSVLWRVPGKKTRGDVIKFKQKGDVMIQAEGEYEMLEGVRKIEVRKSGVALKVVRM